LQQYLIEGEAAREELDQQARQLVALAEHSIAAASMPQVTRPDRNSFPDRSGFLDKMTQEMRVPLNGIINMTDALRSKHLPESARDCVEAVRRCGDALVAIVDDVLDFSTLESGRLPLERADFEIAQVVAQATQIVRSAARRKLLAVRTYLDPALPAVVSGDALRIRQILLNLLSNAIKFTSEGEIELRAELRAATRKGYEIYFSVKDNGIGIAPLQQALLFQPFSRTNNAAAGQFGGSGLGLAICKRLAELMGGAIGVTSTPGSGSLFWFTVLAGRPKRPAR
jgi:signal transduction histidine kinase